MVVARIYWRELKYKLYLCFWTYADSSIVPMGGRQLEREENWTAAELMEGLSGAAADAHVEAQRAREQAAQERAQREDSLKALPCLSSAESVRAHLSAFAAALATASSSSSAASATSTTASAAIATTEASGGASPSAERAAQAEEKRRRRALDTDLNAVRPQNPTRASKRAALAASSPASAAPRNIGLENGGSGGGGGENDSGNGTGGGDGGGGGRIVETAAHNKPSKRSRAEKIEERSEDWLRTAQRRFELALSSCAAAARASAPLARGRQGPVGSLAAESDGGREPVREALSCALMSASGSTETGGAGASADAGAGTRADAAAVAGSSTAAGSADAAARTGPNAGASACASDSRVDESWAGLREYWAAKRPRVDEPLPPPSEAALPRSASLPTALTALLMAGRESKQVQAMRNAHNFQTSMHLLNNLPVNFFFFKEL